MPLNSLDLLLQKILAQPQWKKQKRFHELAECWFKVINSTVAKNTRPYCLRDDILVINTSNSVWSQHLSLQRYTLLKKINSLVYQPIKDLHFSPARWTTNIPVIDEEADISSNHPSQIEINDYDNNYTTNKSEPSVIKDDTPSEAMKKWFTNLETNRQSLPLCPRCQTPTPKGELERWGICMCCFAQEKT